jgi:cell wall-associated NlpC family hydrolase
MSLRRIAVLALASFSVACATASGATLHLGDRGLRLGARGHDVRVLQDLLTHSGFATPVDGRFGAGTRAAVVRFQRAAHLAASGAVGRATVAALRSGAGGRTPAFRPVPSSTAVPSSTTGTIDAGGLAHAPAGVPQPVVDAVAAGNAIATLPYRWGGGHRDFIDTGYDCSGSVSYALHGAGLLDASLTSGELAGWGTAGPGTWITIYADADHTFAVIAGLRFDTSGQARAGTRWQAAPRSTAGFTVRHPQDL